MYLLKFKKLKKYIFILIAYDLLRRMVVKDPNGRISANDCLKHKYFHPAPKKEESKEQPTDEYAPDQFDEDDFMQKNYSA